MCDLRYEHTTREPLQLLIDPSLHTCLPQQSVDIGLWTSITTPLLIKPFTYFTPLYCVCITWMKHLRSVTRAVGYRI